MLTKHETDQVAEAFALYEARQLTIAYRQGDLDAETMPFPNEGDKQSASDISDAWLLDSLNQHPLELLRETCRVEDPTISNEDILTALRHRWSTIIHTVVFFDEDTNETLATVRVFTETSSPGATVDAIQIAATARKHLTNASARVLDPDTGAEVAAYGADEIEEWWA